MTFTAEHPRLLERQPSLTEHAVELAPEIVASQGTATFTMSARSRAAITVPPRLVGSTWFRPALAQFESVMSLRHDWDSYGGAPTSVSSVQKAISFLGTYLQSRSLPPTVVPMSDGGIQLVWHEHGLDVEATFPATDDPGVYVRDIAANREIDVNPDAVPDRDVLREAFQRLSA